MEDYYHRLITAYFDKTISDEGLTQLQDWIEESADNLAQFSETIQILEAAKYAVQKPARTRQNWERIHAYVTAAQASHEPAVNSMQWLYVAAACLITCIVGWGGVRWIKAHQRPKYDIISNTDGKHSKIILPDSSTVYLGGGSTLKYVKNFDGDKRLVSLNGEAFFDVVHRAKPFVVKSGEISTVVLGTSFNVKAYSAEKKVSVTVKSGKVGVLATANGKTHLVKYLVKDEQISINTGNGLYTFNTVDASGADAWVNNDLTFYNTSFKDISETLGHHYGANIAFTDPELGAVRLTAKFKHLSLEQVMNNLCSLSDLAYTRKGNQLFISQKDEKGGRIMR